MWRGDLTSVDIPEGFVITKVDPETGQTVIVCFSLSDSSYALPGQCTDLLNDSEVEGEISIKAYHPRFFLLK